MKQLNFNTFLLIGLTALCGLAVHKLDKLNTQAIQNEVRMDGFARQMDEMKSAQARFQERLDGMRPWRQ